jgi:hypothetical protein
MSVGGKWALVRDVLSVARALPYLEYCRLFLGPAAAAPIARRLASERRHPVADRNRVRHAISLVDRLLGQNCYRRVLLELALDRGAADEPVFFGLMSEGGPQSGHAWVGRDEAAEARYDAVFSI